MIIARLFYWQVIRFDELSALAEGQHLRSYSLDAPRGKIYSSDKGILVLDQPVFDLFATSSQIQDKDKLSQQVARTLAGSPADYLDLSFQLKEKLSKNVSWVSLLKGLDWNSKSKIERLNILGLGFETRLESLYPEGSSAAHLLGFVGSDSLGAKTGYFGLEGFYDRELKGRGGKMKEETGAQGQPILIGQFFKKEPQAGHDLILNLDRSVQHIVEKKLKEGVAKYAAKGGTVIVMDPKTGGILAMASVPDYDPNSFADFPKENFKNPAVADTYEPGSTFKVIVMSAAINEKIVTPQTKCDICSGPIPIGEYFIRTWNNKYYPDSTMNDVLIHSDNTGMVFIGKRMKLDTLYQYLQNFGFDDLTGIDLQDETAVPMRPKNNWKEIDLATATFGQGIALTPIQMVSAVAVIANGGLLMKPEVVQVIQSQGKTTKIEPKIVRRVISEETAHTVAQMMVEAVEKGEAKVFALKGFKIAGKTGTAQIPVAGHYDETKTIASFVGFAPFVDPKFVMLISYKEPSSSIFGSETAAPTFFAIAKEILSYYNIAPGQ